MDEDTARIAKTYAAVSSLVSSKCSKDGKCDVAEQEATAAVSSLPCLATLRAG
jgi:hypothetical protein